MARLHGTQFAVKRILACAKKSLLASGIEGVEYGDGPDQGREVPEPNNEPRSKLLERPSDVGLRWAAVLESNTLIQPGPAADSAFRASADQASRISGAYELSGPRTSAARSYRLSAVKSSMSQAHRTEWGVPRYVELATVAITPSARSPIQSTNIYRTWVSIHLQGLLCVGPSGRFVANVDSSGRTPGLVEYLFYALLSMKSLRH